MPKCNSCGGTSVVPVGDEVVSCTECYGTGDANACPECRGDGRVMSYTNYHEPNTETQCVNCNGTGRVDGED